MNSINLYGRICHELELKEANKNSVYVRFSLAVADGKDKDGNVLTQFIPCVAWNSLAETLCQFAEKGDRLAVEGKLNLQKYTEKGEEKPRTTVQVILTRVHFVETKADRDEKEDKEEKTTYKRRR